MSWQVGAFAVLAGALASGFAWYERSRPDSRVVALVATLAALAALGRIAFAALPNIKPTTDIVLIAGYALGGAPGFAVGATAGLTSNFFFGQGPWTPWQMAAWGATGVIGALLARLSGRRLGRWPLALVCFVVGYAFTAVQDLGDWVTYSDHSLTQLGVYVGRGTAFDLVHACGCLVFALAFGPALAHSLRRFTARLEVSWHPAPAAGRVGKASTATVAALAVALVCAAGVTLRVPAARAAGDPAGYLLGAQNGDGGFGAAPGRPSGAMYSGWAALGLESAGHDPAGISRGGSSLLGYVEQNGAGAGDPGSLERTILVVAAAGDSPADVAGHNLVGELLGDIGGDGSVSDQMNLTAFAVLALRAAGAPVPDRMLSWLASQQGGDGGYSYSPGGGSDVDDTGAVLEALGGRQPTASRAIRFIEAQQNSDGGLPSQPGSSSNAQSTAWAVQGLLAAGVDPSSVHRGGSPSPMDYLRAMTASDGHVSYAAGNDQTPVWVTAQALMALEGKPLPLPAPGHGAAAAGRAHHHGANAAAGASAAARAAARRHARLRHGGATMVELQRLAAGAGVLAALAYAPVGIG